MARVTGNRIWKIRTNKSNEAIFTNPAELEEEAYAYFDWCDRTPLYRSELVKFKGYAYEQEVTLGRPYSIDGLTVYLRVTPSYFRRRKQLLSEKIAAGKATPTDVEMLDTIERLETIIRTQQIEGAAVGIFKENIVSRINGLGDNVNTTVSAAASLNVTVRDQATADNLAKLEDLL